MASHWRFRLIRQAVIRRSGFSPPDYGATTMPSESSSPREPKAKAARLVKDRPRADSRGSRRGQGEGTDPSQSDILKRFAESTSRVVHQAAYILEEEIAAGIVAAKQIEARLVDVEQLRSQEQNEVVRLLRRDSHEVVDLLVDMLDVSVTALGNAIRRAMTTNGGGGGAPGSGGDNPLVINTEPVKPGATASASITLDNDDESGSSTIGFHGSELIDAAGGRIAASAIAFEPPKISLPAGGSADVRISVKVPAAAHRGVYSGSFRRAGRTSFARCWS
jgi:hypothetical protein